MLIFYLQSHIWPILVLVLWAKMLSANQIARFFKMWYLKKEVNDIVYFWHADKHRRLVQVDTIIIKFLYLFNISRKPLFFACKWTRKFSQPGMLKVPKIISLQYLCNISWKTWWMNLIFCLHINVKSFFKLLYYIILDVCGQACANYPK